jgi:hypothetical protein
MRRRRMRSWNILAIAAVSVSLIGELLSAETIDRIAVTVGSHVISEQDVMQEIRVSAFLDGARPDFSGEEKRKAADRLVDRYLVLQEAAATRTPLPTAANAASLLAEVQARYGTAEKFQEALRAAGITEEALRNHLLAGLQMMRYTDLRFRAEVQVTEAALRAYYDSVMANGAGTSGQPAGSFEENRATIEKLLTDQQTMQALDRWLGMTRSNTQILYRDAVFR